MVSRLDSIQSPSLGVYEANLFYVIHDNSWQSNGSNDIDVYLQPLIKELKELWFDGVQTFCKK